MITHFETAVSVNDCVHCEVYAFARIDVERKCVYRALNPSDSIFEPNHVFKELIGSIGNERSADGKEVSIINSKLHGVSSRLGADVVT